MLQSKVDKEGLVPLTEISCSGGKLFCGQQEVYVDPNATSVFDGLISSDRLTAISKIRCLERDIRMKRAPIFGVPFIEAFKKIQSLGDTRVQSSYQRADWTELSKVGVVGTLVAHIEKIEHCVKFECWELFNLDSDLFYVHGEIDLESGVFTHLDGATIYYSKDEIEALMYRHIVSRGVKQDKLFRLDGSFSFEEGHAIMQKFLPLEDLSCEYLEL
ncbi:hypothetical protein FCV43_19910 [Vibrio genomosp. F6]|uniref:hypothetical protein n=1 Tax=Vibrio genomosp. F6 TaxID=723172 RepID=UPI0010BD9E83|nr:hypothetical protein [Vibrio genomosp. F6]TKF13688.1 hypothetical protein FCV43_19910 [Vibrio genomosp. F6]